MLSIALLFSSASQAQEKTNLGGYLVPMCVYNGDTIPAFQIPTIYIFKPLKFRNKKEQMEYYKLVRNVKKVYPIANEKARQRHIKRVEKGLKEQYTPRMKKLSFAQGKLLIKLVDRQSHQSSYELVKAFMGPFKAGFYQTFAALFGASLKKQYDPEGEDKLTERVIVLVESGQL